MVLSYSRKAYSEAAVRQDTETIPALFENGLRVFGGVAATAELGQLKSGGTEGRLV
jgi:hypothetical protein